MILINFVKVAIDGPSGAGKSSVARAVSRLLEFTYIDTGAMYRALGLAAIMANVDTKNCAAVSLLLNKVDIHIEAKRNKQFVFLNGENVTILIRDPKVAIAASDVSSIGEVRLKMAEIQRRMAQQANVIMDGRDIGTCVLPDADVKIFLTASLAARTRRRLGELKRKGYQTTYDNVRRDIKYRDINDSSRKVSPLVPAQDSILLDTTHMTFGESINLVYRTIKEHM